MTSLRAEQLGIAVSNIIAMQTLSSNHDVIISQGRCTTAGDTLKIHLGNRTLDRGKSLLNISPLHMYCHLEWAADWSESECCSLYIHGRQIKFSESACLRLRMLFVGLATVYLPIVIGNEIFSSRDWSFSLSDSLKHDYGAYPQRVMHGEHISMLDYWVDSLSPEMKWTDLKSFDFWSQCQCQCRCQM